MKNYTITVNGNVYNVTVEEGAAAGSAVSRQVPVQPVQPAKAPEVKEAAPAAGSAGTIKVNAPMPGKVVAVKANVGDKVKKGQAVIVLEAMKMENDIVAPEDGIVASINVAAGSAVEAGETMATLN